MNETKPSTALLAAGGMPQSIVPKTFEDVYRLARVFAATALVPKDFQNNPEACCVAIMAGLDLGLTPMTSLQSIAVINGRPSLWGDTMLGVVRASGLLEAMKEEDDGATAKCTVKRKGDTDPVVRTFSVEDAKRAGLSGKSGPWTQYPHRMRQMRARSWAIRDAFPDVLRGIASAEEMQDVTPMKDITPPPSVPALDLPDIDDGTAQPTERKETDKEYLVRFRNIVTAHKDDPNAASQIYEADLDEILTRGLEQECNDIINEVCGHFLMGTWSMIMQPVSEPENLDLPWETAPAEPAKEPAIVEGVYKKLSAYQAQMAKAPNETRAKDIQRSWSAYIDGLGARDKAQFQSVYAQTASRLRASKQAAE